MSIEFKAREMLGMGDVRTIPPRVSRSRLGRREGLTSRDGKQQVDEPVPLFVIEEVGQHLARYPTQDQFLITLDPKVSCG